MESLAQRNVSYPCWDLNPVSPSPQRSRFSQLLLQFIMRVEERFWKHSTLSDCAILYTHHTTVSYRYPSRQYNICHYILKYVIPLFMEVPITFNLSILLNSIRLFCYSMEFNIQNINLTQLKLGKLKKLQFRKSDKMFISNNIANILRRREQMREILTWFTMTENNI